MNLLAFVRAANGDAVICNINVSNDGTLQWTFSDIVIEAGR
jgi:hypothetical protein